MKNLLLFATILLLTSFSSANLAIKDASNLTGDELSDFFEGKNPKHALKFSKGETLPLELFCKSEFFSLQNQDKKTSYLIQIEKEFYIYSPKQNNVLFSLDNKNWKPFFEIVTGTFHVGLEKDPSHDLFISIGGELNERGAK